MIIPPKDCNAHLASAWTAGISLLFLGIGLQGAVAPLRPEIKIQVAQIDVGDEVMAEEFNAPAPPAEEDTAEPELEDPVVEMEIPPIPEISAPLSPPEMVELTPLEEIIERPKPPTQPKPVAKPQEPRPRPVAASKPAAKPGPTGTPGGTGPPTVFSGGGSGRYPSPSYPSAARSSGAQGSVRLLVTVEASGLPSSVSVNSSSGHSSLDSAASDHVRRRWRWPAGEVRRYIVPIKFVLQ